MILNHIAIRWGNTTYRPLCNINLKAFNNWNPKKIIYGTVLSYQALRKRVFSDMLFGEGSYCRPYSLKIASSYLITLSCVFTSKCFQRSSTGAMKWVKNLTVYIIKLCLAKNPYILKYEDIVDYCCCHFRCIGFQKEGGYCKWWDAQD